MTILSKNEKVEKRFECPVCDKSINANMFVDGTCSDCETKGWWIDPAGGTHCDPGGEEFSDPAKMYE